MQPEETNDTPAIASAITLGKALIEALGLQDRKNITRIQIDAQAMQPVRVVVTQLMQQDQGLAACALMKTSWVLQPSGEPPTLETVRPDDSAAGRS